MREKVGTASNVTYDDTEYTVTVTLTSDTPPTESVTIGTQNITIHNYTSAVAVTNADGSELETGTSPTFTNPVKYIPDAINISIPGRKVVRTGAPDTRFTFQLLDGNGDVLETETLTGAGQFTIDSLTYDTVGKHTYTVRETHGGQDGWTYDSTVYTVTVDVTTDASGDLTASVTYSIDGASCGEIVFTMSG